MMFRSTWRRSSPSIVYTLLCVCWLIAGIRHATAQYRSRVWTAEDGLPQNIIRGIAQTPDGYLWVATLNGLARFDGMRFVVFEKSTTSGLVSNRLGSMLETPDGDLWMNAAESRGLTRYHNGAFQAYDILVLGFTQDGKGGFWILTPEGILQWSPASESFVPVHPLTGKPVRTLLWNNAGFWTVLNGQLVCFEQGRTHRYNLPLQVSPDTLWGAATDTDGTAWIETLDGKQFHLAVSSLGQLPIAQKTGSILAADGHRWNFRIERKLERTLVDPASGIRDSIDMRRYFEDREKNLWIGTEGNGLIEIQPQTIQVFSREQGLPGKVVYPVLEDTKGNLWAGIWGVGLSRIHNGQVTTFTQANGLHDLRIIALAQDHNGQLWVGTHGSLEVMEGEHFRQPFPLPLPSSYLVQAILEDSNRTLWVGTSRGLVAHHANQTTLYTAANGLATNDVRVMIEAPDKSLWIGGYGGLSLWTNGHFFHWTEKDGLPSNSIRSLYLDSDGVLWIGTYDGGIGRMERGRISKISKANGLYDNGVFQILEDAHRNFWISSNRGIYRVSRDNLNRFAAGDVKTVTSISYGKIDGMLNVECNGGSSPAGSRTRDGRLLFPTQDGIATVNSAALTFNAVPPPVRIESYSLDNKAARATGLAIVPPQTETIEIQYTALSFINSAQLQFRYRLVGFDSGWVDAGTRRSAFYSHLPPGKYRFRVIAENRDGVWNEKGESIDLVVLARFYQTIWFRALCVLAVLLFLSFLWYLRVRAIHKRQRMQEAFSHELISSQESERQRIAAELHDGVIQHFVAIKNLGNMCVHSEGPYPGSLMHQITEQANAGIDETRGISYNLRPVVLDHLGLTKAIESIVRNISETSTLHIHCTMDNIDEVFPRDWRINLYRIVQEAFQNILRHSHATEVHFAVLNSEHQVLMTIQDNGRGFVIDETTSGFGLIGMSERARLLGGTFEYRTGTSGTSIVVRVPHPADSSYA